jgi:hypothetical protein
MNAIQSSQFLKDLVIRELEAMTDEVAYVLSSIEIDSPRAHDLGKWIIQRSRDAIRSTVAGDDVKYLWGFLYELLGAYGIATGPYREDVLGEFVRVVDAAPS